MKDSFILEGKKYISSKRASEISDYSSDYVGQLCRAEKLDCKRIGRVWFVTEESLHRHKANILHDEISRNRIENLRGKKKVASIVENDNSVEEEKDEVSIDSDSSDKAIEVSPSLVWKISEPGKIVAEKTIKYLSDDRPLLPILNKNLDKVSENSKKDFVSVKINVSSGNSEKNIASVEDSKKVSAVSIKPAGNLKPAIVSYPELTRSIILKRVLVGMTVVVLSIGVGMTALKVFNNNGKTLASNNSNSIEANVINVVDSFLSSIRGGYQNILAFFSESSQLSMNQISDDKVKVAQDVSNGIAVVAGSGSEEMDEAIKQKIKDSFSDDVEVKPDKSGTAGVITPIFRETKGKDFIYVMVPVENKAMP